MNPLQDLLQRVTAGVPAWAFQLALAAIAAAAGIGIGLAIRRRIRENDVLQYEFISTVSHKFRTPLTEIQWAADNLAEGLPKEKLPALEIIQNADLRLVELTGMLVSLTGEESRPRTYTFAIADISETARQVLSNNAKPLAEKKITASFKAGGEYFAQADSPKLKFAMQTMIENAIFYSKEGQHIDVSVLASPDEVTFRVRDAGIGIPREELTRVGSRFFRSEEARLCHTEGMGIGLFLSKEFIEKQQGKFWFESLGRGKGSTFFLSLKRT